MYLVKNIHVDACNYDLASDLFFKICFVSYLTLVYIFEGDKYREVLDIPPTLALPSAMVRRAQIARVGRRPYVLAKHAHFMHLRSVSERKGEDEQDEASESHGLAIKEILARLGPKGSPVPEIFASAEEGHPLTFLPYMQDTVRQTVLHFLRF